MIKVCIFYNKDICDSYHWEVNSRCSDYEFEFFNFVASFKSYREACKYARRFKHVISKIEIKKRRRII